MPLLGGTKYGFIRTITQSEEGSQAKNKVDSIGISDGSNLDISYSREMDPVEALEKQVKLLRQQKEYWKSQTKRTDGKKADSKAVRKLVLQPISNKKREPKKRSPQFWSEWRDSNPRPHGPEPCAIPNFATPR